MTTKNRINPVSLADIQESILGESRKEAEAKHDEVRKSFDVQKIMAEVDAEVGNDRNAPEWNDRFFSLADERRTEVKKMEKELANSKPAGADHAVASEYVRQCLSSQGNADEVAEYLRQLNGCKVVIGEDGHFGFSRKAGRQVGGGQSGGEKRSRPRIHSVHHVDASGNEKWSGDLHEFHLAHAEQTGYTTEMGSGRRDDGLRHFYSKGPVVDKEKGICYPTADGRFQTFTIRGGDTGSANHDAVMANKIMSPGDRVEFRNDETGVVAYHRQDEDGNTWTSRDGDVASEVTKNYK